MNICGVLVHANPAKLPDVENAILALPGAEIHANAPGGRLVVTLEDTDRALALDCLTAIHRIGGVVAAALVYHHFESGDAEAPSGKMGE